MDIACDKSQHWQGSIHHGVHAICNVGCVHISKVTLAHVWSTKQTRSQSGLVRGYSEPHANIMGPPGILGLFISGSK